MSGRLEHSEPRGNNMPGASRSSAEEVLRLQEPAEERPRVSKRKIFALSGLGLFLVLKMADSIHYHYHDGNSTITFRNCVSGTDV